MAVYSVGSILDAAELLNVNRLHHLLAVCHGGFLERLACAQFFYDAGFFKLTFEFLESSFDELAFFYLYYYHYLVLIDYLLFIQRGKVSDNFSYDKDLPS